MVHFLWLMVSFVAVARKSANGVVSCCKVSSLPASEHWKLLNCSVVVTESQSAEDSSGEIESSRKRIKLSWLVLLEKLLIFDAVINTARWTRCKTVLYWWVWQDSIMNFRSKPNVSFFLIYGMKLAVSCFVIRVNVHKKFSFSSTADDIVKFSLHLVVFSSVVSCDQWNVNTSVYYVKITRYSREMSGKKFCQWKVA